MTNATAALQAAQDFANQADADAETADTSVRALVATTKSAVAVAAKAAATKAGAHAALDAMKVAAGVTAASPVKLGEWALAIGVGLLVVLGGGAAVAHYVLHWL